jgi:aminoglycoside 6'-N-acetyltransferase I
MVESVITPVDAGSAADAVDLLLQFFVEGGFTGTRGQIAGNLNAMLAEDDCWAALAVVDGVPAGIVTVSTTRDIEYGRIAEFGDLYIRPDYRGRGLAQQLMEAGQAWCKSIGCNAVLLTIARADNEQEGLVRFYRKLGFELTDRMIAECRL